MGSAGVVVQGLDSGRLAAASVCRRLPLTWAGRNASSSWCGCIAYDSRASTATAVGFCDVSARRWDKKGRPRSLGSLRGVQPKRLSCGRSIVQLRLLLDAFPVSRYMKKEAKWAKPLKTGIEELDSKQPGRTIFMALKGTLTCPHYQIRVSFAEDRVPFVVSLSGHKTNTHLWIAGIVWRTGASSNLNYVCLFAPYSSAKLPYDHFKFTSRYRDCLKTFWWSLCLRFFEEWEVSHTKVKINVIPENHQKFRTWSCSDIWSIVLL